MASNKFSGEIGLEGAEGAGTANGAVSWVRDGGAVAAGIYVTEGVPVGDLGGKLTAGSRALVIRADAPDIANMLYVTVNGGTAWTAVTVP